MHEIKTVDVKGVKLAYREYGSGDKYLLSTQNFFFKDSHMALLGQPRYDYHCFLVYMRGYGESEHIFDRSLPSITRASPTATGHPGTSPSIGRNSLRPMSVWMASPSTTSRETCRVL